MRISTDMILKNMIAKLVKTSRNNKQNLTLKGKKF